MPRTNIHGGKHHKKGKKNKDVVEIKNDKITYATNNQIYGFVKKKMGGTRLELECSDNKKRSAIIPGKFFKRIWINQGDILLCDLNINSDDSVCYIVHKYSYRDANILKSRGHINFEIIEEADDQGYKFTDSNQKAISPQRNIPDLNNIDSDDDDTDSLPIINKIKKKHSDSDEDDIDIDDL